MDHREPLVKGLFDNSQGRPQTFFEVHRIGRLLHTTTHRDVAPVRHLLLVRRLAAIDPPTGPMIGRAAAVIAATVTLAVLAAAFAVVPTAGAALPPAGYRSTISLVTASQLSSSWRPGCPVGPDQLRRVTLTHWGFDGALRTGELIVHADVAGQVAEAFGELFRLQFPIERMRPIEAYGGSDDASMADNNTSGFNCRLVTGGTSWSWHAYGRAIDVNPVQNPYVRGSTILPPAGVAHLNRSPAQGRLVAGQGTVEAFTSRGWTWGGNWTSPRDYQHFERRSGPAGAAVAPADAGAAVASPVAGTVHLVQRAGSGAVVVRTRTGGGWSGPTDLGGYATSTPDVTADGTHVDVVIRGADGAVWHRRRSGGSWSAWASLGGGIASGPAIVASSSGRLDVFARGLDGALWTRTALQGSAWGPWLSLGGGLTSDPDAVSWGSGRIDVVARGADGAIWHRASSGGTWHAWASLGGVSSSGPGIASSAANRLDVLTRGSDGALYSRWWDGARWSGWLGLGGLVASDPDAAAEPGGNGPLHVVAAGADGLSVWARSRGTTWGPWAPWPSS